MSDCVVTAVSESKAAVRARRVGGVKVLGITVLGMPVGFENATIHLTAREL